MKLADASDLLVGRTIAEVTLEVCNDIDAIVVQSLVLDDGSILYLKGHDDGRVYLDFMLHGPLGDREYVNFDPDPDEEESEDDWEEEEEQDAEDEARDNAAVDLRAICDANDWRFIADGVPVCNVCGCYGAFDYASEDPRKIDHIRKLADVFEPWQRRIFRRQISTLRDADIFLEADVVEAHKDDEWPAEDPYATHVQRWFKIKATNDHEYLVGIAKVPWSADPVYVMASFMVVRGSIGNSGWKRMILDN